MNHTELFRQIVADASTLPVFASVLPAGIMDALTVEDVTDAPLIGMRGLVAQWPDFNLGACLPVDEDDVRADQLPTPEHYYLVLSCALSGDVIHVTRGKGDTAPSVAFDDGLHDYRTALTRRYADILAQAEEACDLLPDAPEGVDAVTLTARGLVAEIGPSGVQVFIAHPSRAAGLLPALDTFTVALVAAYLGEVLSVSRSGADDDAQLAHEARGQAYLDMYYPEQTA